MEALFFAIDIGLMIVLLFGIIRADKTGDAERLGLFAYAEKKIVRKSRQSAPDPF